MEHVKEILAGLAIFLCVIAFIGGLFLVPFNIASDNNQKVQNLTQLCISKGYDGWTDERHREEGANLPAGCYNQEAK